VRSPKRPSQYEVSQYMRSLVEKRWQKYRLRVARGEISAENYVYRPRGPMPPHSKAKQDMTRWESQIASARLICLALDGRKLSVRQIERMAAKTGSPKRPRRLHLRFGGKPPIQWHSVHYGRRSSVVPS